jgi:2-amino-4-hydroxy-6-hydroxymethyldihydropteridine diphosphokinase
MTSAVLSVGSNLGDRLGHLRSAVDGLGPALVGVSAVYETPPWGGVEQDDFLNAVLLVDDPDTGAHGWLRRARELEAAAGRVRQVRWGPRTLDVDVITVDGVRSGDPELTLPHPRAHQRAFVLVPWLDVQPAAALPGHGPVRELVDRLSPAERAGLRRRDDLPLRTGRTRTGPAGTADPAGPAGSTDPADPADSAGPSNPAEPAGTTTGPGSGHD